MSRRELKNKPLVEAIFELRWVLKQQSPGFSIDPHYRLLLGRLYDRLVDSYPFHEQLETANMPDEILAHVVQHRFRKAKEDWPLVQLGPGIFTVNDTHKYKWEDFRPCVLEAKKKLLDSYPKPDEFQIENLMLRYVDAIELDYKSEDVLAFLKDKLKVAISLPDGLFQESKADPIPQLLQMQLSYKSKNPCGNVHIKFATGQKSGKNALIWETILQSDATDLESTPFDFSDWLDQSHSLINDWFFKLIDGELQRKFSGE